MKKILSNINILLNNDIIEKEKDDDEIENIKDDENERQAKILDKNAYCYSLLNEVILLVSKNNNFEIIYFQFQLQKKELLFLLIL